MRADDVTLIRDQRERQRRSRRSTPRCRIPLACSLRTLQQPLHRAESDESRGHSDQDRPGTVRQAPRPCRAQSGGRDRRAQRRCGRRAARPGWRQVEAAVGQASRAWPSTRSRMPPRLSARSGRSPSRCWPSRRARSASRAAVAAIVTAVTGRAALRATVAVAGEQAAFVEPVRAVAPEFDRVRDQPEARPVRRPRHVLAVEARSHFLEALLEGLAAVERARLVRRPGAELRIARLRLAK